MAPRRARPAMRTARSATRPAFRPSSSPQGRALYRGHGSHPRRHHDPRAHTTPRAKVPPAQSGLAVARARVRDVPWETSHWLELADILYRRGEFDLASKAYRRVQEIVAEGKTVRKSGPLVARPPAAAAPPAPSPPTPAPEGAGTEPQGPVVAVPKVPIITSSSGQTRAIRLPGTNIMIAVTGLAPSPSSLPPPRRLRSPEASPHAAPPEPRAPVASTARAAERPIPGADPNVRSVLEQDMLRFLQIFDRPAASGGQKEKKRDETSAPDPKEGDPPPSS
ncbi:MAG: hypothetical protein KGI98_06645 [Euryarchaeota archaeon]|nr:hypothetical protein [Euryarchaeota archaeon]